MANISWSVIARSACPQPVVSISYSQTAEEGDERKTDVLNAVRQWCLRDCLARAARASLLLRQQNRALPMWLPVRKYGGSAAGWFLAAAQVVLWMTIQMEGSYIYQRAGT